MMALVLIVVGVIASVVSGPSSPPPPPAQTTTVTPPAPPPAPPPPPTEKELAKQKADAAALAAATNKVRALKDNPFCVEVGRNIRAKEQKQPYTSALMDRAAREFDVQALDYSFIRDRGLRVGMSWCAVFASWGLPEHANTSTNAYGTRHQLVYGNRRYAYLQNNRLTSWQH